MKNKIFSFLFLFALITFCLKAQTVTTVPKIITEDISADIIFDATGTGLDGYTQDDVYAHIGVITDKSATDADWKYGPPFWKDNSPKYKLVMLGGNKWKLVLSPTIRDYFGVPVTESIKKLAMVFRNGDASKEGKGPGNTDIFIPLKGNGGLVVTTVTDFITADQANSAIVFHSNLCSGSMNGYLGDDIYAHTGVITDKSTSDTDWKYAPAWTGNAPDAKYKLTALGDNKWQLNFTPNIRAYYGVPDGEKILKVALLFRNSDGSIQGKGSDDGDIFIPVSESGQLVETLPVFLQESKSAKIILNAPLSSEGGLTGYLGDVYAHTGVITSKSKSDADWRYAPVWGTNEAKYKMTMIDENKWELDLTSDIRSFYDVPADEQILKLAFVFRNADGSKQLKDGANDVLLPVYNSDLAVRFVTPTKTQLVDKWSSLDIKAISSIATDLTLLNNGEVVATATNATSISYTASFSTEGEYTLTVKAGTDPNVATESIKVYVKGDLMSAPRPTGVVPGANIIDDNTVTFVLHAPGKTNVYLLGDFNDWAISNDYMLKIDGAYWWITVNNLEKGKEYAYQYLVDGDILIADPYTEKVLDPWNDPYIPETVYPNLKKYPEGKTTGIVSVVATGQTPYQWKVQDFVAPTKDKMVIYELLIRDFTAEHSYESTAQKLDYLQTLGVNVIELLPVNEFEGNSSWGYNPSFYFALDKYYGTKNAFKAFIDECHRRGIAVVIDMVLNHSFSQSPFVQLYLDKKTGLVTEGNPWFNVHSPNTAYSWGYDFDHELQETKDLVDSVNKYWLTEYKVDGFRFDFTKGFTNKPGDGWEYDQSRIDILKRMTREIYNVKSDAIVIFEHLATNDEEKSLSDAGIMLWGNMNHNYKEAIMGYTENNKTDLEWSLFTKRGYTQPNLVSYMESHDEERLMYASLTWGMDKTLSTGLKRAALAANFYITLPGPKMIWQFGEVGYDYSINACSDGTVDPDGGCRTAEKPIHWEYINDTERKALYDVYAKLCNLKQKEPVFSSTSTDYSLGGGQKYFVWKGDNVNAFVIGNFDATAQNISLTLPKAGRWYNVFDDSFMDVESANYSTTLQAGEYKMYIDTKKSTGIDVNVENNTTIVITNNTIYFSDKADVLSVYDVKGTQTGQAHNVDQFDISRLDKGVYILKMKNQNGVSVRKFIKE